MEPIVMTHPLIKYKLSRLRDERTSTKEFRELVSEISMLMCYEATTNLPTTPVNVKTPVGVAQCDMIDKTIIFVPILRAGLGMVTGMLTLIPSAKVGHIGVFRNPRDLKPVEYYCKLPKPIKNAEVILLDPMLATGGSAVFAAQKLKSYGAENLKFMCLVAAPEGIEAFTSAHPDIQVYCGALDKHLNDHGYIVPGLGDAGDRIFGTK